MQCRAIALSGILCVVSTGGCGHDERDYEEPCAYVISPEECDEPMDEDDEDDPLEPSCTYEPDGLLRTVFQCNGQLTATIQFQTLIGDCPQLLGQAQSCQQSHQFGIGLDPYELPAVMACCDAQGVSADEVLVHCAADMVEQVCRSIPVRMQELIDGESLKDKKVARKQVQALQAWLEANPLKCRAALLHHAEVPGVVQSRSFEVPNNPDWSLIRDFTITLDEAVVESAVVPENPGDQVSCSDAHLNDAALLRVPARGT